MERYRYKRDILEITNLAMNTPPSAASRSTISSERIDRDYGAVLIYAVLALAALLSVLPMLHTVAVSFSHSSKAATSIGFLVVTLTAYPLSKRRKGFPNATSSHGFWYSRCSFHRPSSRCTSPSRASTSSGTSGLWCCRGSRTCFSSSWC